MKKMFFLILGAIIFASCSPFLYPTGSLQSFEDTVPEDSVVLIANNNIVGFYHNKKKLFSPKVTVSIWNNSGFSISYQTELYLGDPISEIDLRPFKLLPGNYTFKVAYLVPFFLNENRGEQKFSKIEIEIS